MRLLLITRMPPSLGGLETMGALIAKEWGKDPSLELKVVTSVKGSGPTDGGYALIRCPTLSQLDGLYRWADVVFFNHCCLGLSAPLLWRKKPYVLSMSGTMEHTRTDSINLNARRWILRGIIRSASGVIAACKYVAKKNGIPARIIPNPYDSSIYYPKPDYNKEFDFFYGGRVDQKVKGCFDLLEAFERCQRDSERLLTLTVVGDGPDLPALKERVKRAGLGSRVRFLGILRGSALADEMRKHSVIVVPSRYQEPIGIICLEGIACGCVAVGSEGGGLGESVGSCGFTYPNGDVTALTEAMWKALNLNDEERKMLLAAKARHLASYLPSVVCEGYLNVVRDVMAGNRSAQEPFAASHELQA